MKTKLAQFVIFFLLIKSLISWKTECDVEVVDVVCSDDSIYFNLSISEYCSVPFVAMFNYDTDVESERYYVNLTIDCYDCYVDLFIDSVRDAWNYYLRLDNGKVSTNESLLFSVECDGQTRAWVWISTLVITCLMVILGIVVCVYRFHHRRKYREF